MTVGGGGATIGGGSSGEYEESAQHGKNGTMGGRGGVVGGRFTGGRNAGRMPPADPALDAPTEPACAHPLAGARPTVSSTRHTTTSRAMDKVYSLAFALDNNRRGRFAELDG